jgi:hypothetical protein
VNCRNCGFELRPTDRYCPDCGQAVADGRDRSLAHLVRSSIAELASVDSRLWRSLRMLLFRPGYLSREYREGRRRRYLSPIGLFLLGNLLYFVAPPLSDLQLSLFEQYELQPYSPLIRDWVDGYVAESGRTIGEVASRYQLRIVELAKLMVILHVPLLALGTMLLFADRRLYYADHVVIGLHYFAFLMIYLISIAALLALIYGLANALAPDSLPTSISGITQLIIFLQFLYVPPMLKRALDVPWWRAILSTPAFVALLLAAHFAYRWIQFYIGFALVSAT